MILRRKTKSRDQAEMEVRFVIAAALGTYLLVGLAWISLPGVQQDEALFVTASFPPSPISSYAAKLQIFNWDIPSMLMPYLGALKGLLWRGLFILWPPSVYSVRLPAVLLGGVALLLFYCWVRRFYSEFTALVALTLAATEPIYIFSARLDWGPVVFAHVFSLGGLFFATRWLQNSSNRDSQKPGHGDLRTLAAAGFFFGLGLWDKATFLWFLLALSAALLIFFLREVMGRVRPVPLAVFVAALLLGALPLVLYNVSPRGPRTRDAVRAETMNREVFLAKLACLQATLDGRFIYRMVGDELAHPEARPPQSVRWLETFSPSLGTLLPWALVAVGLLALAAPSARRAVGFPLLVSGLMWAMMVPLKNAGWGPHHYSLAYPFPHLAVAAGMGWTWQRTGSRVRSALGVALVALLLFQVIWDVRHLKLFRETGGVGNWSDGTYQIANYLKANPPGLLLNMDWGFSGPLLLLTKGNLPQRDFSPIALADAEQEEVYRQELLEHFRQPDARFLFHTERFETFPAIRRFFQRALATSGMQACNLRTFYQRDGAALARLVKVQRRPCSPE